MSIPIEIARELERLERKISNHETHVVSSDGAIEAIYQGLDIVPLADATEILTVYKADGTTIVFDVSTSGTPNLSMPNGANVVGFSDAFVTQKWFLNSTTGNIIADSLSITNNIAAATISLSGNIQAATASVTNAITCGSLNAASGDVECDSLVLTNTAHSVAAGKVSLGTTTSATVGAAGAAAALPATPTGYLEFYLAGTKFKLPYYAA